jgi:hypothetical protein
MSQIETSESNGIFKYGKREISSGDLKEIYMFLRNVASVSSMTSISDQSKNKKSIGWNGFSS